MKGMKTCKKSFFEMVNHDSEDLRVGNLTLKPLVILTLVNDIKCLPGKCYSILPANFTT